MVDSVDFWCRFADEGDEWGDVITLWSGDGPRVAAAMYAAKRCINTTLPARVQVRREGVKSWSRPYVVTINVEPG